MKKGYKKSTPKMVREMIELRLAGWSYPKIGKKVGRDHTTVIYWVKKFQIEKKMPEPVKEKRLRQAMGDTDPLPPIIPRKPKTKTTEELRIKEMSSWEKFIYKISKRKQQEKCSHRAMVFGKCWMCGYTNKDNERI